MVDLNSELAENKVEPLDANKCIANTLGLAEDGSFTDDEIVEIIANRDYVGKGSRSRYGRLLCEFEGCEVACTVELVDSMPVVRGVTQLFKILDECVVFNQITIQPGDA